VNFPKRCALCGSGFGTPGMPFNTEDRICPTCRRRASIGEAVEAVLLEHVTFWIRQRTWMPGEPWQVSIPDVVEAHEEIGTGSTPLAALRSAMGIEEAKP
jgi:hypothetical protein